MNVDDNQKAAVQTCVVGEIMTASVGTIVHYYDQHNDGPFAAITVRMIGGEKDRLELHVVWPASFMHRDVKVENVPFHESDTSDGIEISGYWVWAPRLS